MSSMSPSDIQSISANGAASITKSRFIPTASPAKIRSSQSWSITCAPSREVTHPIRFTSEDEAFSRDFFLTNAVRNQRYKPYDARVDNRDNRLEQNETVSVRSNTASRRLTIDWQNPVYMHGQPYAFYPVYGAGDASLYYIGKANDRTARDSGRLTRRTIIRELNPGSRLREVDASRRRVTSRSFSRSAPSFITNKTRSVALMSAVGSPGIATMSAASLSRASRFWPRCLTSPRPPKWPPATHRSATSRAPSSAQILSHSLRADKRRHRFRKRSSRQS